MKSNGQMESHPGPATKTILFLDHTAKMGGGEVALLGLVRALDRSRFTPIVALASAGPLCEKLQAAGVETHVLLLDSSIVEARKDNLGYKSLFRFRQASLCIAYAVRLARFARRHGVHLIHTNSLKADVYGGLAGRLARIPVLWHVRDIIGDGYLPSSLATLFRVLIKILPRQVIANSESTRRHLRPARANSVPVVYSGVSDERLTDPVLSGSSGPQGQGSPQTIALVGRIADWKGQHIFLRAAALVRDQFPQARFQIIGAPLFGENEYERSLHRTVCDLGLGDCVEFLGFREDVPVLLAGADLVVHASTLGEPFGQVVIEGMAAGKAVIATDGGALPEIVIPGVTGLLVPMGDAPAMAGAMAALLSDPARAAAMGAAGRERVRERFTIGHTVRKLEGIYEFLLK